MTSAQLKRLYFPTWHRTFKATWLWERGMLSTLPTAVPSDARDMVETHARVFADAEVRGVEPDDLRHSANALALQQARTFRAGSGQPLPSRPAAASSSLFDGLALDLFRALCALIVEPDWLGNEDRPGLIWWENPAEAERHRIISMLDRRSVPGYASRLCLDPHGTRDYHTLDHASLLRLHRTLLGRPGAWMQTPTDSRRPVRAGTN